MQRVMVTGFARQARYVAALLNEHVPELQAQYYPVERLSGPSAIAGALRCDAFIHVGGPRPHSVLRKICEQRKRPAIVLWVGTDVLNVMRTPDVCEALALEQLVHWSCGRRLIDELRACGIQARYVPIAAARVPPTPASLPPIFTVLAYLPHPHRKFYGEQAVWEAARSLPGTRFIVVGEGQPDAGAPPNLTYAGEVPDINAFIDQSTVLFRLTQHDGLPAMIVETVARGRYVVCSTEFPCVTYARSQGDAIAVLRDLYQAHVDGRLGINEDGMRYIRAEHSRSAIAHGMAAALHDAIAAKRQARESPPRHLLAISGTDVLSARAARNCEAIFPQYRPLLLRTSTRSDVAVSAFDLACSRLWYTVGQPNPPHLFEFIADTLRKPRVVHWLEGDVERLARDSGLLRKYRLRRYVHLASDEHVLDKLRALGLTAEIAGAGPAHERIKSPA